MRGWSGGTKVLGKLSAPGRHTNLENSRVRRIALAVGVGGGSLDIFLSSVFSFSLSGRRPDIDSSTVSKGR